MNIFLFAAPSASGKTTISTAVSLKYDLPRIDLHQILHDLAVEYGYARAREWVLSVGLEEVLNLTRMRLFEKIETNKNARGIIIDEVIDEGTLNLIKDAYPESNIKTIFVEAHQHDRVRFISKRINADDETHALEEIQFIDGLKQRLGITGVIEQAEVRINNYGRIEEAVDEVCEYIGRMLRSSEGSVKKERGS